MSYQTILDAFTQKLATVTTIPIVVRKKAEVFEYDERPIILVCMADGKASPFTFKQTLVEYRVDVHLFSNNGDLLDTNIYNNTNVISDIVEQMYSLPKAPDQYLDGVDLIGVNLTYSVPFEREKLKQGLDVNSVRFIYEVLE